ncbi:MAG TPA: alpha/beta hydrolase family protein [Armatimonadaceae bacterium]|nr:alpha/beta hydrolase family protein [Armatimonadaceae bacterium]
MNQKTETTLDPRAYSRQRIADCPHRFDWARLSPDGDLGAWQAEFRAAFLKTLGRLEEWERVPLNVRVEESTALDGYRRDRVRFTTRPGLDAVGYLLVPDGVTGPVPAVVCLPGHGRGMDSTVGIAEDGSQRALGAPDEYQADFPLRCVAHGWVAFVIEQVSFGERRDAEALAKGGGNSSCHMDSTAALMLGESVSGWRVWDAMRAIDYVLTLDGVVDPARVATMGISGGGLTSLFTAAVDTRVAACVVSGYLCTFEASVLGVFHCVDNFVPGLLALCEMPDLTALVAPRPLFAESGDKDPIFPLPGFRTAVARAGEVYRAFGVPENFGHEVFDGDHRFHGVGAFAFLERLFAGRERP